MKKDPMPHNVKPMLATLTEAPFDRKGWIFEIKWDGYRAIAEVENKKVNLYSRNGRPFTSKYPSITHALENVAHDCVLDGEIVALKGGKPDFELLQQYEVKQVPLQYVAFDVLYCDGRDMKNEPLSRRKKVLKGILPENSQLFYSDHAKEKGISFFKHMVEGGLEGMIAKDAKSPYIEGVRSDSWKKVKNIREQEAVIIGYTEPRGSRTYLGALVLAVYEEGRLSYIGHSGGGFKEREREELYNALQKLRTKEPPIKEKVPINSPITWVKPKLVCDVRFTEWTEGGRMRHPIYKGLRQDKTPSEVVKEEPDKKEDAVQVTNREKVFWPDEGFTKGDVVHYYEQMAETMLPYLIDRPENLNRHPNGIRGKNFYQKNITFDVPDYVTTKRIWSDSNDDYITYLLCQNKESLLYMANLGCIEVNPWNSRVGSIDTPDYMIFDLDPNGRPFAELISVAQTVREVLEIACTENYIKTSGKSGLHILVPLGARYDYKIIRNFSELVMRVVHRRLPEATSVERSPKKRQGKIYLDYLQNRRAQTLAAPYSLRPYPGATVSAPLAWHEVKKSLDPSKFNIKTIFSRLERMGDLLKPLLESTTDLKEAVRCLGRHLR